MRVRRKTLIICSVFVILVIVWQWAIGVGKVDATIIPGPWETLIATWELRSILAIDFLVTLLEVIAGFLVTVFSAMTIAIILHLFPSFARPLNPILLVIQCVPLIAVAPILFYAFGNPWLFRLITIVLAAFFPVLVNTAAGLSGTDRDLLDLFQSMNATRMQRLFKLEIPRALHVIFAGFRITLTMCLVGAVLAEMLVGEMIGLGYRIKQQNAHFKVNGAFASMLLLSIMAILLVAFLGYLSRKFQSRSST